MSCGCCCSQQLFPSLLSPVLGVFLWPLVSPQDVSLWLKPVLQKLDFGVGEFLQKIKENHGNSGFGPLSEAKGT